MFYQNSLMLFRFLYEKKNTSGIVANYNGARRDIDRIMKEVIALRVGVGRGNDFLC